MKKLKKILLFGAIVSFFLVPVLSYSEEVSDGAICDPLSNTVVGNEQNVTEEPEVATEGEEGVRSATAGSTYILVIPSGAFINSGGLSEGSTNFYGTNGYIRGNGSGFGCVSAPAFLPIGATVTSLYVSYIDDDASVDMTVGLRRVRHTTGAPANSTTLAVVESSLSSSNIRVSGTATIIDPVVSNSYSYYVSTCLANANLKLYSVRIYYTLQAEFKSVILKN